MTVRPDMLNGHGTCHGGLVFALADSAFAFACNSRDVVTVASGCAIEFLAPAAERATSSSPRRRSAPCEGRNGVYDVDVRRADGELVATFRGRSAATATAFLDSKQRRPAGPSRSAARGLRPWRFAWTPGRSTQRSCSAPSSSSSAARPPSSRRGDDARLQLVVISFAFGLALLAGLYAFGEVSGGHYNPPSRSPCSWTVA